MRGKWVCKTRLGVVRKKIFYHGLAPSEGRRWKDKEGGEQKGVDQYRYGPNSEKIMSEVFVKSLVF